jgi:tetrapyrrole methylase family protein/MazG family protein
MTPIPKNLRLFSTLNRIMARLRAPRGCPWDKEQTHVSLKSSLLEETYEVLDAIDRQKPEKLCEELGDLLMQIVFHAQIAEEHGEFDINDVVEGINTKLIRRHPHIFGDARVSNAEQVAVNWQAIKQEERHEQKSVLESLPKALPALAYGQSIQSRAASMGFDWEKVDDILDKLKEEVAELKAAATKEEVNAEFGDVLFTLVNLARRLKVDSEASLRMTNEKFVKRFSYMEDICRKQGIELKSLSLKEQDALWDEAKKIVG